MTHLKALATMFVVFVCLSVANAETVYFLVAEANGAIGIAAYGVYAGRDVEKVGGLPRGAYLDTYHLPLILFWRSALSLGSSFSRYWKSISGSCSR